MIYYVKSQNYISQRSSKRRGFSSGIRFPPTVNVERVGWNYPLTDPYLRFRDRIGAVDMSQKVATRGH
jgi:hypothetical protein